MKVDPLEYAGIKQNRRGGYVKDADKVQGLKTAQVGLRLPPAETELMDRVCEHWSISRTSWMTYAILVFLDLQQKELLPDQSDRLRLMREWVPPSPTPDTANMRLAPRIKSRLVAQTSGISFSKAVRWILLSEAPRALLTPSAKERRSAEHALRAQFAMTPREVVKVSVPAGQSWEDES